MKPYRFTHLSGRCRSGGDHAGCIVHLVPTRNGSMGVAVCGKKPAAKSNGWSEYDDDKLTCPRCIEIATSEPLPEYIPAPVSEEAHVNKVKFRWGEETYTLCVTKDDCWLEDGPSDISDRMLKGMDELAMENGMAPPANLCAGCWRGTYTDIIQDYQIGDIIIKDLELRKCSECGHVILPSSSVEKVDEVMTKQNQLACEAGKGAKRL